MNLFKNSQYLSTMITYYYESSFTLENKLFLHKR